MINDQDTYDQKASTSIRNNDAALIEDEKLIVKSLAGADSDQIQLNDSGWTSRVYVIDNGRLVFKFPRTESVKKEYVQEIKIYKLLEQLQIHLQVPKLRWTHPHNDYFGYEGIVGTQFTSQVTSLSEEEKSKLGNDIGEFLRQLHKLNLDDPHVMNVEDEIRQAKEKYAGCSPTLHERFSTEEIARLDSFINELMPATMRQLGQDTALCHGDLGYWNLLIKDDGLLGAIDFGDIGYYDRSKDFCGLQDRAILDAALETYGDNAILRQKIDIRQKFLPFFDLQYFAASQNEQATNETLTKIRTALLE